MPSKICKKCKTKKDISEFSPHKTGFLGVHSKCKVCRSRNPSRIIERENYLKSIEGLTKTCKDCNKIKPLSEFGQSKRYKSGYTNSCKQCITYYRNNPKGSHGESYSEIQSGENQTCEFCGKEYDISNFFRKRGSRYYLLKRCRSCRSDNSKQKIKLQLIIEKGPFCYLCKYDGTKNPAAMDFHHISPETKDFDIGRASNLEDARKEAEKCVLLCANCHRGLHAGVFCLDKTEL